MSLGFGETGHPVPVGGTSFVFIPLRVFDKSCSNVLLHMFAPLCSNTPFYTWLLLDRSLHRGVPTPIHEDWR